MATAIKGKWESRASKHWSFTESKTPLREAQEQKNAGHSSDFLKNKVKAESQGGSRLCKAPFLDESCRGTARRAACRGGYSRSGVRRTKGASVCIQGCTQDPLPKAPARKAPPKDDLLPFSNNASNTPS